MFSSSFRCYTNATTWPINARFLRTKQRAFIAKYHDSFSLHYDDSPLRDFSCWQCIVLEGLNCWYWGVLSSRFYREHSIISSFFIEQCVVSSCFSVYLFILFDHEINIFARVNHARICFWNQPVLMYEGRVVIRKETTGAFNGFRTHPGPITSETRYALLHWKLSEKKSN